MYPSLSNLVETAVFILLKQYSFNMIIVNFYQFFNSFCPFFCVLLTVFLIIDITNPHDEVFFPTSDISHICTYVPLFDTRKSFGKYSDKEHSFPPR